MRLNFLSLIEARTKTAQETAESLKEILERISSVATLVEGISQINMARTQVDQVTQHSTANADEADSAAQEMATCARELREILSYFILEDNAAGVDQKYGSYGMNHSGPYTEHDAATVDQFLESAIHRADGSTPSFIHTTAPACRGGRAFIVNQANVNCPCAPISLACMFTPCGHAPVQGALQLKHAEPP